MREFNLPKNRKLKVDYDQDGLNPRKDYDNLGTIVSWHMRYNLGDENINMREYFSAKEAVNANSTKNDIILPIYLFDHSGLTIQTVPFVGGYHARFDSGQVGFIKVSKKKVRDEYGCKRVTKNVLDKVIRILNSEVEEYDKYLKGETYFMEIVDKDGEQEECVGGFLGYDINSNGILDTLCKEDKLAVEKVINNVA
jgi:hypothetical protein